MTKGEYKCIYIFLSMKNKQCYKEVQGKEDVYFIFSQLAITDAEIEGLFVDYYTGQIMEHLPWAQDRPQKKAFNYNCISLACKHV